MPKIDRLIFLSEDILYKTSAVILILMGMYVALSSIINFVTQMNDLSTIENILSLVENILLILVLASLIHTVRLTVISKKLRPKPYLIVGIIASLRRIIILTVEISIALEKPHKNDYFIKAFCSQNGMPSKKLDKSAQKKILQYPFPGNVRELKAAIELAAVLSDDLTISAEDINVEQAKYHVLGADRTLKQHNTEIIQEYLDKYDHDVLKVADILDIGKSTIYKMIKNKELKGK